MKHKLNSFTLWRYLGLLDPLCNFFVLVYCILIIKWEKKKERRRIKSDNEITIQCAIETQKKNIVILDILKQTYMPQIENEDNR